MLTAALVAGYLSQIHAQPTSWTDPAPLNTNAATDTGADRVPQVTTDGAGTWVAVWQSDDTLDGTIGTDTDILTARSTDGGATWTPVAALNTNAATDSVGDFNPQVTTDGAGTWVAVWQSADILTARSTDGGATWADPVPVNSDAATGGGGSNPQVTTDGDGTWVAVWDSNALSSDSDIFVVRSTDGGVTWTPVAALNTNAATDSGSDFNPQVTTDGAGTWVAVWRSTEDLGTIGADRDILVARSTDGGATWTDPAPLNSNAATDSGNDNDPQVTTDGAGTWVAVWTSRDDLGGTIGTEPDVLTARSVDGGVSWTPPEPLNTDAATDSVADGQAQVATDGAGSWVAVWVTGGSQEDILTASSTDGGATWTDPVRLHPPNSGNDNEPQLTTDGAGTWLAVWSSNDDLGGTIGTDRDIFVARGAGEPEPTPTPTAAGVGGIAELPRPDGQKGEMAGGPSDGGRSSGLGAGVLAGTAATIAAGGALLYGAAWYGGRRQR